MQTIHITEIEQAINHFRDQNPASTDSFSICPEARALADVYALMIYHRQDCIDAAALSQKQLTTLQAYFTSRDSAPGDQEQAEDAERSSCRA